MNIMKVEEIEAWAQSQGHEDVVKLCQAYALLDTKVAELEHYKEHASSVFRKILPDYRSYGDKQHTDK